MTTVSGHVAVALARHVDHVFGVMGNGNAFFLNALAEGTKVGFTALRHEAGGVVAADAHHRTSRRLAAATCTYGPGFTNTLTPLAEGRQAHVPLVLVTGDAPTSGVRPWDIDQPGSASAIGVRTFVVHGEDAARVTRDAVAHALAAREPVVLAIPYDLARLDVGEVPDTEPVDPPRPMAPDAGPVATTAALLRDARRPLLLAGRGAWLADAGPALGELADALGAVTCSTALGRGIFPRPEFDLGVTGGFGAERSMELVREADVVVVVGAALNQFTMRFGDLFSPGTRVVQVDLTEGPTHARVDAFVRGDARLVAERLVAALAGHSPTGWRESVGVPALAGRDAGEGIAPDGRLDPRSVAARLAELLPNDRVVVSDGGHFIAWANMYWPVASPERMVMVGTAFQSIGQGFPSVAGAAVARPDSTVVLTTGDGGGLMAIADLESAVRVAGGRGLCVVWNDAAYGAEVNLYGLMGLREEPMWIPQVDFATVARGFGAHGVAVDDLSDLDVLADWVRTPASERPFLLLDCRISTTVIAPYQREVIRINTSH